MGILPDLRAAGLPGPRNRPLSSRPDGQEQQETPPPLTYIDSDPPTGVEAHHEEGNIFQGKGAIIRSASEWDSSRRTTTCITGDTTGQDPPPTVRSTEPEIDESQETNRPRTNGDQIWGRDRPESRHPIFQQPKLLKSTVEQMSRREATETVEITASGRIPQREDSPGPAMSDVVVDYPSDEHILDNGSSAYAASNQRTSDTPRVPPLLERPSHGDPSTPIGDLPSHEDPLSSPTDDDYFSDTEASLREAELRLSAQRQSEARRAATEIFPLFAGLEDGCTRAEHEESAETHRVAVREHCNLSITYEAWHDHSALRKETVGLSSDTFPCSKGLRRADFAAASILRKSYEGVDEPGDPVKHVCLHTETIRPAIPVLEFDGDSILAFPPSLGCAKQGIEFCPAKNNSHNLQNDVHVRRKIRFEAPTGILRSKTVPVHRVPHFYIGTVNGLPHSSILLGVPRLYEEGKNFTFMPDTHVEKFFDSVLHPVLVNHITPTTIQGFPQSQSVAELNARAKSTEQTSATTVRGNKQYAHYAIPGPALPNIWDDVRRRIADRRNDLRIFDDAFLVFSVKGVKASYGGFASLHRCLLNFQQVIENALEIGDDLLDQLFVDIGRQICNPFSQALFGDDDELDGDPAVYLWKRCCLEKIKLRLQSRCFAPYQGKTQFYHVAHLNDACCMTFTPPRRSWIYQAGVIYGQAYSSVKSMVDAQKVYPFQGAGALEELGIDPTTWQALASAAKVTHAKSRATLSTSYIKNKERVRRTLRDSRHASYGSRFEVRITWRLFLEFLREAAEYENENPHATYQPTAHPESVWAITTLNFNEFVYQYYDRVTSTIETIVASSSERGVTLESFHLIRVLFKCLETFFNCDLRLHPVLCKTRVEGATGTSLGMGFQDNMAEYGFAWFLPVVDWLRLRFFDHVSPRLIGIDKKLVSWYEHHASHQLSSRAEDIQELLRWRIHGSLTPRLQEEILDLIAHIVLQEYRRVVLRLMEKDTIYHHSEEVMNLDSIEFSHQSFSDIFTNPLHYVSGNRTGKKDPRDLSTWLFGPYTSLVKGPEGYRRDHFENKSFRLWTKMIRESLEEHDHLHRTFEDRLHHLLFEYHYLIPYPDTNGTLISTEKDTGHRQVYTARWGVPKRSKKKTSRNRMKNTLIGIPSSAKQIISGGPSLQWVWGDGVKRPGQPPKYPDTLGMTLDNLREHFRPRLPRREG